MASRALANILGGVMSGVAGSMKDRRLKREEEESWNQEKGRKREILDMQEEYATRREDRTRQQRKADEQEMFDLSQTRLKQLQQQKLDEIAKLFPDRWQDQQFQQDVTAGIMGIKVPALPADKKIAALAQSGKIDEALKLAFQSKNPEDMKFYQDVITAITQRKRLDMLLNPAKYQQPAFGSIARPDAQFIQGALDQGQRSASDMLSAFLPGGGMGGVGGNPMVTMPGPSPIAKPAVSDKGELQRLKSLVSAQQGIVKDLESRRSSFDLPASEKAQIDKEYKNATDRMRLYQQQYLSALGGGDQSSSIGGRPIGDILKGINEL
jgi:hypothetical protein